MTCLTATHQNRGQGQRELFSSGASIEQIEFFLHCMRDACTESYIVNLDERLVTQRAGTSIEDIKCHNPTWIDVTVPDELFNEFFPHIAQQLQLVQDLMDCSELTNKDKDNLCLDVAT